MQKLVVTPSSEIIYSKDQRTTYYLVDGALRSRLTYPEKRFEPQIDMFLAPHKDNGDYVAQGQYKWSANCSHLLYDVLSDHLVIRELTGSKILIHKMNQLSSQLLRVTGSGVLPGIEGAADNTTGEFSYIDIPNATGNWRFAGHQHSFLSGIIRKSLSSLMVTDDSLPKNLIIERRLTSSHPVRNRNIHDIPSFTERVSAAGGKFHRISLEDLTLTDQIKYFYNAERIISIHGSGLVWLNFCKEGTKVVEILPPWFFRDGYLKHDFWIIGQQRGLAYRSLYVEELVGDPSTAYDFDVVVPGDAVLELLT